MCAYTAHTLFLHRTFYTVHSEGTAEGSDIMNEMARLNFKLGIFLLIGAATVWCCAASSECDRTPTDNVAAGAIVGASTALGILSIEKALLL